MQSLLVLARQMVVPYIGRITDDKVKSLRFIYRWLNACEVVNMEDKRAVRPQFSRGLSVMRIKLKTFHLGYSSSRVTTEKSGVECPRSKSRLKKLHFRVYW
jgi:hypothetical protein